MAASASTALLLVRTLMAATAQWQTITGTVSTDAAKAFIYLHRIEPRPDVPFAVLHTDNASGRLVGSGQTYEHRGSVSGYIEVAKSASSSMVEKYYDAWDAVFLVFEQMGALSGTGSHILISDWEVDAPKEEGRNEDADDDYWQFRFRLAWGPA